MANFPEIDYHVGFVPLNDLQELPPSPKAMYTMLKGENIVRNDYLECMEVSNITNLEDKIFEKIKDFKSSDSELKDIFLLIHIWGGKGSRGLFSKGSGFVWEEIKDSYRTLVEACLDAPKPDKPDSNICSLDAAEKSMIPVYCAANEFCHQTNNIGAAFVTKHTRFWLTKNNPCNPLPIYDSTFAANIMERKKYAQLCDVIPYWHLMIKKAQEEQMSLLALERLLFKHYNTSYTNSKK